MTTSPGATAPNGSDVENDVRCLIDRYGAKSTKEAINRLTNRKPRTKLRGDWQFLGDFLKADARCWLEGGDPFNERSDYSIAKWFAENHPDRNVEFESTFRRIKRRLAKDRRYYALVEAFWLSEAEYSYQGHLAALRELCLASRSQATWRSALKRAEDTLSIYHHKLGVPPAAMTMRELEMAAVDLMAAELAARRKNFLAGLLSADRRSRARVIGTNILRS